MSSRIRWSSVSSLLQDESNLAAIDATYPLKQRISFLSALEQISPAEAQSIHEAGRRLGVASQLANYPIIAIAGMLNSGKTSLVATFLSDNGRSRSLRGESNREGTHRFVLWLPETWREDADVWGLLMSRLAESLGQPPEMLADDPNVAHQQYNNAKGDADALGIPLVATDPGLDQTGVGLLDCPDIVTSEAFGKGAVEARQSFLSRAATLCSGFVIVTDFSAIRAKTVGHLLQIAAESMPQVNRYLAINMIRPKYQPREVREDISPLLDSHGIIGSYLAYDFEIPGSDKLTPSIGDNGDSEDPLPVFFETPEESDATPIQDLPAERLLSALPSRLNRSALFEGFLKSQELAVTKCVWESGFDWVRDNIDQQHAFACNARQAICDSALDFFARRGNDGEIAELRLHQSPQIISQLTEAFSQAAPWYARLGMRMNGFFANLTLKATSVLRSLNLSGAARDKAHEIRDMMRQGSRGAMLTAPRLRDAFVLHDVAGQMRIELQRDLLDEKCQMIVGRFDEEDKTVLDPQQLRETAEAMWADQSLIKKLQHGLTPLAAMLASFAAVMMVPVDGGGTLIVMHASIAELLLAAGFTGLVTAWNSHGSLKAMELQAAKQQLSEFVAICCDALGVPRLSDHTKEAKPIEFHVAGRRQTLPTPDATSKPPVDPPLRIWTLRHEFESELHKRLPRD